AEAMAQALESANQYVTNQLSASLPGNLPTSIQNATLQPQNPPIAPTPSYYNTQSPPVHNGAAVHQQPSHYGMTPPYGSFPRNTGISNAGFVKPTSKSSRSKTPTIYIVFALVLLFSIGLLLAKQGIIPTPGFTTNQNTGSTTATAFTENFQSTTRNWTAGTIGGLKTGIVNKQYDIQISGGSATTYFPHPVVGTLPDTFTLTVTMKQTLGGPNAWFGLAFREKDDGNGGNVTCYAFGIQTNGSST